MVVMHKGKGCEIHPVQVRRKVTDERLKHLGRRSVAVCETESAGMELYLAEKSKAGINIQGSLAAGSLPQLLCAQG